MIQDRVLTQTLQPVWFWCGVAKNSKESRLKSVLLKSRQQPVYIQFRLRSEVHLAIGYSRNRELNSRAGHIP